MPVYIRVKVGEVVHTAEIAEGNIFFDYSSDGEVVGVEIRKYNLLVESDQPRAGEKYQSGG